MAQAVAFFTGFETGDGSEVATLGTGGTVQGTTVRTGAYALQIGTGNCRLVGNTFLATTQSVIRFYFQFTGSLSTPIICQEQTGATGRLRLVFTAGPHLQVSDTGVTLGLTTTTGAATFIAGQWYLVDMALDLAAGGVVKVWIDGVLDINATHTSDVSASLTGTYNLQGTTTQFFFDDVRIDTGGLAQIGAGQVIARQGVAGTPTYDAWTKSSGTTAWNLWSETPFNATNSCHASGAGQAQTMLVAPFSTTQVGHGSQVVGASDAVNATKVAMIAHRVTAAATETIRRRVNGVNTDTVVTIPLTTDSYLQDVLTAVTPANLDLMEVGGVVTPNTGQNYFIQDMWVLVDYTPSAVAPFVPTDWPAPRFTSRPSQFEENNDLTLIAPSTIYPFSQGNWQQPRYAKRPDQFEENNDTPLIAPSTIYPFSQGFWQSPQTARRPAQWEENNDTPLFLPATIYPFAQLDWPRPIVKGRPGQYEAPDPVALILPATIFPFGLYDWPRQGSVQRTPQLEIQLPSSLFSPSTILPFALFEWPRPGDAKRGSQYEAPDPIALILPATILPFALYDWPSPSGDLRISTRSRMEVLLMTPGLTPTPVIVTLYGVTAGPEISAHSGVTLLNAHGVGGRQSGLSGVEGIPHDEPQ